MARIVRPDIECIMSLLSKHTDQQDKPYMKRYLSVMTDLLGSYSKQTHWWEIFDRRDRRNSFSLLEQSFDRQYTNCIENTRWILYTDLQHILGMLSSRRQYHLYRLGTAYTTGPSWHCTDPPRSWYSC